MWNVLYYPYNKSREMLHRKTNLEGSDLWRRSSIKSIPNKARSMNVKSTYADRTV